MKTKAVSIALAIVLSAYAAFGASGGARRRTLPPPGEKKPAQCGTVNPVVDYANRLRVYAPQRHANLSLFAISVSGVKAPHVDLPLDRAVQQGLVEIAELDDADVNRLRVRNRAKEPVFVMAGEMLRGGKQDRIAGDDLILPARSELTIPVFCVEHGRWTGRERGFDVGHSLAGAQVRRSAGRGGGQGAVWSRVEQQQETLRAPSATGALRSVHDSQAVRDQMKPYLRALGGLPDDHPKATGVVAVAGDEIIAADLFSSRRLFQSIWPDLLEAYVIDALEQEDSRPVVRHRGEQRTALEEEDVLRWLNGLRSARMLSKDTPGEGDLFDLSGHDLNGSALLYDCGVVHLGLFPGEIAVAEPDFNSLQFRRERVR